MNRRSLFKAAAGAVTALAAAPFASLAARRTYAHGGYPDVSRLSPYSLPCHNMKDYPCRLTVRDCVALDANPAPFDPASLRVSVVRSLKRTLRIA